MKFLFFIFYVLPIAAAAQVMQINDPEKEFNEKHLESNPVNLKKAPGMKMDVVLSATGHSLFLTLMGSGTGASTIDKDNEAILTLDNNSTITVKSVAVQGFDSKGLVITYKHTYTILPEDVERLSRYKLRQIRKYSMSEFDDIEPDEKGVENLKASCALFLQALEKRNLPTSVTNSTTPAFPGGKEVFMKFLNRNLKLQPILNKGEKLNAVVQFSVGTDGSINNIKVVQSAGPNFDNELLRILKRMPKWKPALNTGKQIDAVVTQQLSFYRNDSVIKIAF